MHLFKELIRHFVGAYILLGTIECCRIVAFILCDIISIYMFCIQLNNQTFTKYVSHKHMYEVVCSKWKIMKH